MGRGPGVRAVGNAIQIDFKWQGRRYRQRLRLEPNSKNLRYATNLKARIEHEIVTGTFDYARHFNHVERRDGGLPGLSVSGFLSRFVESASESIQPETAREYRDAVAIIAGTDFAKRPIKDLTLREVKDWLATLKVGRKRQNNILIPLRGAIREAIENDELTIDPLASLKIKDQGTRVKIDPFSREEVEALSQAYCGNLWKFWAWTGMRSGEIAGLEWRDVDGGWSFVRVGRAVRLGREKPPKTEAGARSVRLLGPARDALGTGELRAGPVWINPVTGRGFRSDKQLRVAFHKACKEAEVRYRYPYQLRHTFASWAMAAGEPIMWIAHQMGHKDATMVLKTYAKFAPDLYSDAGQKMII